MRRRQFGRVVRVTVNDGMPRHFREILMKNMELEKRISTRFGGPLGLSSLMSIASLERPELRYSPFSPRQLGNTSEGPRATASLPRFESATFCCIIPSTLLFQWLIF